MKDNKAIFFCSISLMIMIGVFLAAGCGPQSTPKQEVAPDPFTVVWGPGKDRVVTFSGDSAGHAAGEVSEFEIKLDNNSSQQWQGYYIVQLLDRDRIVMDIERQSFDIRPGMEYQDDIRVEFDAGLDGPYGLSLYIPVREAQSIQTIWIGQKNAVNVGQWPSIATHPWLWSESSASIDGMTEEMAEEFLINSPTFSFDGIRESLTLRDSVAHATRFVSEGNTTEETTVQEFYFQFDCRQAGYGDREGQILAEVITPHEALIIVENGAIKSAVIDNRWDMIKQCIIADSL